MPQSLTTPANAEAWLGLTPGADAAADALVARLISAASQTVLNWLNRSIILPQAVSETRDGTGTKRMMLREWPVLSVTSLAIGGITVPGGSYAGSGFAGRAGYFVGGWDGVPPGRAAALELNGYEFGRAPQAVAIGYRAGYRVDGEKQTVSSSAVTAAQPWGTWASDQGVTYADGTPLTIVTGAPGQGQYRLGTTPGQYVFNAADDAADVLLSYGYVPAPVEQATIDLVAQAYNRGKQFDGLSGLTEMKAGDAALKFARPMAGAIAAAEIAGPLEPYRRVAPY